MCPDRRGAGKTQIDKIIYIQIQYIQENVNKKGSDVKKKKKYR